MENSNEISSSEDEFDFELIRNLSIHDEIDGRASTNSDEDSNIVSGIRNRKIRERIRKWQ